LLLPSEILERSGLLGQCALGGQPLMLLAL